MGNSTNFQRTTRGANRRWFRFSLRTLLLVFALVAVWLGITVNAARRQKAAVTTLQRSGATILYDYTEVAPRTWSSSGQPTGPAWLRNLLGEDYFHHPVYASIRNRSEGDEDLISELNALPGLKTLMFQGDSINDDAIARLGPLNRLEELQISGAQLTDQGLEQVPRFPRLRWLILNSLPITDAGCVSISQLSKLEELSLYDTQVSDNAVTHLKSLHQLQRLTITNTAISEQGAPRAAASFAQLHRLSLTAYWSVDSGAVVSLSAILSQAELLRSSLGRRRE